MLEGWGDELWNDEGRKYMGNNVALVMQIKRCPGDKSCLGTVLRRNSNMAMVTTSSPVSCDQR